MISLGIICARHNSSFKGKNWALVNGIPLIHRSILTAKESNLTRLIVSTDSAMIACLAKELDADVPFKRPDRLATDDCRIEEAVRHGVEFCEKQQECKYDVIVLLQNSSPMRLACDINDCLTLMTQGYTNVLTTTLATHYHPYKAYIGGKSNNYNELVYRRQDLTDAYYENGLVYAVNRDYFMRSNRLRSDYFGMVVVPEYRSIDIHDEWDLVMAEAILKKMELANDNRIDN